VGDGEAAGDEGLARVGAPDVGAEGGVLGVLAEARLLRAQVGISPPPGSTYHLRQDQPIEQGTTLPYTTKLLQAEERKKKNQRKKPVKITRKQKNLKKNWKENLWKTKKTEVITTKKKKPKENLWNNNKYWRKNQKRKNNKIREPTTSESYANGAPSCAAPDAVFDSWFWD
jgi:hypothetical protein